MRKISVITTLLVMMAATAALAQTGNRPGTANPSSEKQNPWPAPTGHRQPRTDQAGRAGEQGAHPRRSILVHSRILHAK